MKLVEESKRKKELEEVKKRAFSQGDTWQDVGRKQRYVPAFKICPSTFDESKIKVVEAEDYGDGVYYIQCLDENMLNLSSGHKVLCLLCSGML